MITRHPSEATITAYAAGTLPEGLALVVATHLTACPLCRRLNHTLEAVGGVMLEDLAPASMAPDALEAVLARGDQPAPAPKLHPAVPGLPPPLNHCSFGAWWPVGIGIRWRPLRVRGAAWAGLLRIEAGKALPRHGHAGLELACVLDGTFADAKGRYEPGDIAEPDADDEHQPVVDGPDPCLCVIASEGMRLRGFLGLAQRLVGR